ncbi:hypothetical protein SAMN05192534_10268 [Alteribacillus persepolensis]|uniref:Uncharacterized protein n=1 Tax=Alteribacillus persepolensis TaxID=568899 RepID=A0A1G8A8X5_9BACI|nr:hypothetical protein [Alteribacillus persepolensis]SDH17402.1 hypothetical protein SAMN05192534_10268 [Alteribacillus persepolensis]
MTQASCETDGELRRGKQSRCLWNASDNRAVTTTVSTNRMVSKKGRGVRDVAVAVELADTKRYGNNGENVASLIERLADIDWYQKAGEQDKAVEEKLAESMKQLGVSTYQIEWIKPGEAADAIASLALEESSIWEQLKEVPDTIKAKMDEVNRETVVDDIVYNIPELVYHGSFAGAYQLFEDEKTTGFFTGHAMYISVLACLWEAAADLDGMKDNPFLPLVEILESGHVPLGLKKETIFVL